MDNINDETIRKFTQEEIDGRRKTSIAIAIALVFLIILFFIVTVVRFGETLENIKKSRHKNTMLFPESQVVALVDVKPQDTIVADNRDNRYAGLRVNQPEKKMEA